MNERFGPWSSALGGEQAPDLSTFWKRRLALLASARSSRLGMSRRDCLKLGAAGAAACALPTLHLAWAEDAKPAANKIYAFAALKAVEGESPSMALYAIDPETATCNEICGFDEGVGIRLSPDRRTLALCRAVNAPRNTGVWTLGSDGKGEMRRVADFGGIASWSPDGKQLIVVKSLSPRIDQDTRIENWRVDVDGSGATKLPIPETDGVDDWSPDGRWVVTVSDRHPPHHQGYQLYLMRPDGKDQRRLTTGGLNLFPRFSPDGRRIAYLGFENGKNSLCVIDVGGGPPRRLEKEIGKLADRLCWSPDGKSLAYTIKDLQEDEKGRTFIKGAEMVILDVDGNNSRRLNLPAAKWLGPPLDWR